MPDLTADVPWRIRLHSIAGQLRVYSILVTVLSCLALLVLGCVAALLASNILALPITLAAAGFALGLLIWPLAALLPTAQDLQPNDDISFVCLTTLVRRKPYRSQFEPDVDFEEGICHYDLAPVRAAAQAALTRQNRSALT